MSILDIDKDTAFIILGDEYSVSISTPAPMSEYSWRYGEWNWEDEYKSLGKMVIDIRNEILNIPMEKFKTYTRYAQIKRILRKYMRTHPYGEKWELSSKRGWSSGVFDWTNVHVRLIGKRYLDDLFTKDMIPLIDITITKNNEHAYPF